jgi:hypothetical protein
VITEGLARSNKHPRNDIARPSVSQWLQRALDTNKHFWTNYEHFKMRQRQQLRLKKLVSRLLLLYRTRSERLAKIYSSKREATCIRSPSNDMTMVVLVAKERPETMAQRPTVVTTKVIATRGTYAGSGCMPCSKSYIFASGQMDDARPLKKLGRTIESLLAESRRTQA